MGEDIEIWQKLQELLAEELGIPAYESWIKPIRFNSLDENTLSVLQTAIPLKNLLIKITWTLLTPSLKNSQAEALNLK